MVYTSALFWGTELQIKFFKPLIISFKTFEVTKKFIIKRLKSKSNHQNVTKKNLWKLSNCCLNKHYMWYHQKMLLICVTTTLELMINKTVFEFYTE